MNKKTKEYTYVNPKPYDSYGFDVNGIYYEIPSIKTVSGNVRELGTDRKKTNPPRIYDDRHFNYEGYYCIVNGLDVVVTKDKYDENGFDRSGYYKELDEDGNKRLFDDNGFNFDGYYSIIDKSGKRVATNSKSDEYGFKQEDYVLYKKGIVRTNIEGFDVEGNYRDEHLNILGKCNRRGFDIDGYYHKLLEDGTRDENHYDSRTDERGFDVNGYFHILLSDGTRRVDHLNETTDLNGFDVDGLFCVYDDSKYRNVGSRRAYNNKGFDVEGYYWELKENGIRVKTDRLYDDNGFGLDGYYWELKENGVRVKTNSKFNEKGLDCRGFRKDGIHSVTKLKYDENYFDINGINCVTNGRYSLTGFNVNGIYNSARVSPVMSEYEGHNEKNDLKCIYVAKKFLRLEFDRKDLVLDDIPGSSRNKKVLLEKLYAYVVAAAVIDPEIKLKLVEYTNNLMKEIENLKELINEEKAKENKNLEQIKLYEKRLAVCNEIKRKTTIGDISGKLY